MMQLTEPQTEPAVAPVRAARKRTGIAGFLSEIYSNRLILLLALPGLVLIFLLKYIPMFGMVVAFEDFQGRHRVLQPVGGL